MNKKLFGISALLALVLAGCNPTPAPSSSSSTTDPSTGDTSDTSTSGGETSSSEPVVAPALEDVMEAFMGLGENHSAEVDFGAAKLNYIRNADYTYLEGVGGVAKITPAADEGGEGQGEGNGEAGGEAQGLARKLAKHSKALSTPELSLDRIVSNDSVANNSILRNGEGNGVINRGEPEAPVTPEPVDDAKFFIVYQDEKGAFHENWGAAFTSQAEYNKYSVATLFQDFDEYYTPAELAEIFVTYSGEEVYFVQDATVIGYFFGYANLDAALSLLGDGFLAVGLTENDAPFIDFYATADSAEPSARMTFKANDAKHNEALEAHLATITEYPTSPVSLAELSLAMGVNFESNNAKATYPSDDGSELTTAKATADAKNITFAGAGWTQAGVDAGSEYGKATVAAGKEIPSGLYRYFVTPDAEHPDMDFSYYTDPADGRFFMPINTTKSLWYDYDYSPLDLDEYFGDYIYESNNAFVVDDEDALEHIVGAFPVLEQTTGFTWTLKGSGGKVTDAIDVLYITYELDENDALKEVNVIAEMKAIDESGKEIGVMGITGEYAIETFTNFGKVQSVGKVSKFLAEEIQTVTISEDMPLEKFMDVNDTYDVKAALDYKPTRANATFETLYEYMGYQDPAIEVSAEGVITAKNPGESGVITTIGGFEHYLPVTVNGLRAFYGLDYAEEFYIAPGADAVEFGFEQYGFDEDATFNIDWTNKEVFTVTAVENTKEGNNDLLYKVSASAIGESVVTLTSGNYSASIKVICGQKVEFTDENAYFSPTKGGELPVDIIAPAGSTFTATSSDPEVATVAYDAEKGAVVVTPVAAGTFTVTLAMDGQADVTDSVKVSITEKDYVREWGLYLSSFGAYFDIVLHEDGSVVVTELVSEETRTGTWTVSEDEYHVPGAAFTFAGEDAAGFGEDNIKLTKLCGGRYDNVAAFVDFTYDVVTPAAEEGQDPTVTPTADYALAYNVAVEELSPNRCYGVVSNDASYANFFGQKVYIYVLNDGTWFAASYETGEVVANGEIWKDADGYVYIASAVSEDGLTMWTIEFGTYSGKPVFVEYKYTRASADADWSIASGVALGYIYTSLY